MLKNPAQKYQPFQPFGATGFKDRSWPDQTITRAPIWMSTDLRDGNQALFEPMDGEKKIRMFKMLVDTGFKEIEVAFPSASQTDYDFVRTLIEEGHIPDDVTIEVLTQAREDLINRTFEALTGARRAIVHVYGAAAPNFRKIVFGKDRAEIKAMAVNSAGLLQACARKYPDTEYIFQYSPEVFSGTELDFALELVDAVTDVWQPTAEHKCIINLPATIEMRTPNVYADQIEWMHRHLARRDGIILSIHPHNDRGCAVAAAELAVMAGADRIEGCLFGHGERTGNVDLVTLALNLYSQGIDPQLDFSRLNEIARTVEQCTQIPVHPRHPYAGDLVFTAFSGSHQDAIRKGMAQQESDQPWVVPYIPVDPADIGRTYDSIIRVNSQSGKGGIAWLLETNYNFVMPRRLQVEFSSAVQHITDAEGTELSAEAIWEAFCAEYLHTATAQAYIDHQLSTQGKQQGVTLTLKQTDGSVQTLHGIGNGPIDAVLHALQVDAVLLNYEERSLGQGSDATAVAYVEIASPDGQYTTFGVGIHPNIVTASVLAILSGIDRLKVKRPLAGAMQSKVS